MIVPPAACSATNWPGVIEEVGDGVPQLQEGPARSGAEFRALPDVLLLLQTPGKSLRRFAVQ